MPLRVARQGVVVATGDGTLVLRGAAAEALLCLPASAEELQARMDGREGARDIESVVAVLEQLAAHDLTVAM
jgi:hypothetical protein